jgi:hypothetical protein
MRQVLTVGITYTGEKIEGVEIENLGLCQAGVDKKPAAFPLYEYDTIIINPQVASFEVAIVLDFAYTQLNAESG